MSERAFCYNFMQHCCSSNPLCPFFQTLVISQHDISFISFSRVHLLGFVSSKYYILIQGYDIHKRMNWCLCFFCKFRAHSSTSLHAAVYTILNMKGGGGSPFYGSAAAPVIFMFQFTIIVVYVVILSRAEHFKIEMSLWRGGGPQ